MKRSKPAVKYQGFALEVPLIDEIKKRIKDDDNYRSVTDYAREAIKEKLQNDKASNRRKELIRDANRVLTGDRHDKITVAIASTDREEMIEENLEYMKEKLNELIIITSNKKREEKR